MAKIGNFGDLRVGRLSEGASAFRGFAYKLGEDQALSNDQCFLCGIRLSAENRTDEHVFPQWLLRKFKLRNSHINLLNGTSLQYSKLKIPCCSICNNEHLSRIEQDVRNAFLDGPEAVASLNKTTLFLWMGKVYYGLMFRELSLLSDQRNPSDGTIITPEFLTSFKMHHLLMQAARGVVCWDGHQFPASIFVFRAQEAMDPSKQFDYVDIVNFPFLAIRIGRTAVVANLQDWGALAEAVEVPALEAAKQLELHPQQFREVAALSAYMAKLFNRTPKHLLNSEGDQVRVITLPIVGVSTKPVFDPFMPEEYAHVLSVIWEIPVEDIWNGSQILTLLQNADGTPYRMPVASDVSVAFSIRGRN